MGFDISTGTTSFTGSECCSGKGCRISSSNHAARLSRLTLTTTSVDASNNTFVVSVNDVKGTVQLPIGAGYTLDSLINGLETAINQLATESGSVSGGHG